MTRKKKPAKFYYPFSNKEEEELSKHPLWNFVELDFVTPKGSRVILESSIYRYKGKVIKKLILTEEVYVVLDKGEKSLKKSFSTYLDLYPQSQIKNLASIRLFIKEIKNGGVLSILEINPALLKLKDNKYTLLEVLVTKDDYVDAQTLLSATSYKDIDNLKRIIRSINAEFLENFNLRGDINKLIVSSRGKGYRINSKYRPIIKKQDTSKYKKPL